MSLPDTYTVPTKDTNYFKPQDGDNKVRLLTDFKVGFIYWTKDRKPVRLKEKPDTIPADMDTSGNIKEMWLALIFNYDTEKVAIWEITQTTIMRAIYEYEREDDFGDSKGFDLKINRAGKELETKYNVIALPPKEIDAKIADAVEAQDLTEKSLEEMFTSVEEEVTEATTPF